MGRPCEAWAAQHDEMCEARGLAGENTTMIVVGTAIRSLGVGPILSAVFTLIPDVVEYCIITRC